jgi:serine/threonine-protein kinase
LSQDDPLSTEKTSGQLLGKGGTAVVYLGWQEGLGREVAIKQPHRLALAELLVREARVMGSLDHPNIPPIYAIQEKEGLPQIVMRRIQGKTWLEELDQKSLDANLKILLQVSQAVACAHAQGIIHRDLKPENVMLGPFGEVFVLDWGLAVRTEQGPLELPLAEDCKEAAGTPAYMAPEMLGSRFGTSPPISIQTDIFLLGAILYRILSGKAPFEQGRS